MVNESQLIASTSNGTFLKCKSFANTATQIVHTTRNVPSRRIQYDTDKEQSQENTSVTAKNPKPRRSSRKRPNRTDNVQDVLSDEDYQPEEKKKTARKKRSLPALKLNYYKISDFFSKATESSQVATLSEVIVLSSSDEDFQQPSQPAGNNLQKRKRITLRPTSPDNKVIEETNLDTVAFRLQNRKRTRVQPTSPDDKVVEETNLDTIAFRVSNCQGGKRIKLRPKCPEYKIIEATSFAVDAFRFGEIAGITKYFLTHFHGDHYVGLTRNFSMPIYMSKITGRLVQAILKVNPVYIKTMDINTSYMIEDVEVVAIDANHCPGAVMFIFKLKDGRVILHTGDFRATPEMESNPVFWNNNFYSVYLDTTYLHKSYDFDSQGDVLCRVEEEVRKFKEKNIGTKFLIVVGSYMIGKERVWCHIAQLFKMKVWLESERKKAMKLIYKEENENPVITDCFSDVPEEAQLHVLPLQCINYPYLADYVKNFEDHNLLAFRPTGWEKNSKPQYGSRISIVGIQYSEHSSYKELERFVRFIRPEKVISTVPKSSSNPNITQKIPNKWLMKDTLEPMKLSCQSTITSFMKVQKNAPAILPASKTPSPLVPLTQLLNNDDEIDESDDTDFMS